MRLFAIPEMLHTRSFVRVVADFFKKFSMEKFESQTSSKN